MIFQLNPNDILFPDPALAEPDGLLAIGGDLRAERLLSAYQEGVFPWYSDDTPILWYSPHERFVLQPNQLKVSKSMRQLLRSEPFYYTHNEAFGRVIDYCSAIKRKNQDDTWITHDMRTAFTTLHDLGYAHSIEVWNQQDQLVGGLYGVLIGKVFSGESMFSLVSNSSKCALIYLCTNFGLTLIDCQIHSDHLKSLGASMISQADYLHILDQQSYYAHGLQSII